MLRQFIRVLFNSAILRAVPGGGGAQDCSGTITAAEALQAEDVRYGAQTHNDFNAMQRLFGDDLVYIHSNAAMDTKASYIESMRSGTVKYRSMKRGDAKARTYGCMAIICGHANFEVTVKGEDKAVDLLFHSVWAKRAAGVQFVSWQATMLPSKE